MLKKTIRRLGALAMVLAMAVSVFAVSASAAREAEVTVYQPTGTATITKKITKEANVLAPNGSYTFTATPVNDAPEDGIALSGQITSAPNADNDIGMTTVDATGAITITATAAKFPRPGTYQYKITEAAGTYADGTAYAAIEYTLDVTVARNEDNDSFGIMAMILKNGTSKSEVYTNPYSPKHETQKNYVVKKVVTGNQGDKNQNFQFTFGVTNSKDNGENGKEYYYVITRRAPAANETGTIKSGKTVTTLLKHNEYVTIYGVSATDTVTANETKTNADKNGYKDLGYEMTSDIAEAKNGDKTQTVTNDKAIETPGGVIMTIAPYALMVVLAGAFAVVFLSRRNRAE